uniref:Secreted protein n=1 Tax=Arundo donax TaxID=35708 RepID=A0A0A9DS38_ARUDO
MYYLLAVVFFFCSSPLYSSELDHGLNFLHCMLTLGICPLCQDDSSILRKCMLYGVPCLKQSHSILNVCTRRIKCYPSSICYLLMTLSCFYSLPTHIILICSTFFCKNNSYLFL